MQPATLPINDERDLVARARRFDKAALRTIVRLNNRRLFRVARSILKDDAEAEDAVQDAYVRAFTHLASFEGRSSLSTWLTRIVANEALGRLRRRRPMATLDENADSGMATILAFTSQPQTDPERIMAQTEIQHLLERAIDVLPDVYRVVLVARVLEEMSVEETAELYDLKPETVKTRLHRARALLRADLEAQLGPKLMQAFPFDGWRCERMADSVIARLEALRS